MKIFKAQINKIRIWPKLKILITAITLPFDSMKYDSFLTGYPASLKNKIPLTVQYIPVPF